MTAPPQSPKLKLTEHEDGAAFPVVVSAGSARSGVRGLLGDSLKVSVRAVPERGKANAELALVLAGFFGVPRASVSIEAGRGARRKLVKITGLDARELLSRVEGILGGK